MLSLSFVKSRSGSRDGIALLAVLAFVLLLTILIISFISFMKLNRLSTASYSNSVQAQQVARGGLQDILSDIHQEIIAGSAHNGTNYTQNGTTIYVPSTNFTAVPARAGYTANLYTNTISPTYLPPTLIRVSRASQNGTATSFYPNFTTNTYYDSTLVQNLINRASPASTGTVSVNGRYISPTRWNKPYLLASSATLLPTPFYGGEPLPTSSYPGTPDLPDWVYVTRTGSRVCTQTELNNGSLSPSSNLIKNYFNGITPSPGVNPPASPVVGRYAFVIYDEGALLDANVAGYPATAIAAGAKYTDPTTGNIQTVSGKSYLAYADLTQLPGLNQTVIDNFVNWRNAGGIASANVSNGNPYLGAIFNYVPNGFMRFISASATSTDSPLMGRQDLINYFAGIDSNINTGSATFSQALPYLGTFSRAVSAPSWSPPADASALNNGINASGGTNGTGNIYKYKTNAETAGFANRDLANVRFSKAGTVTHYLDNATTTKPDGTSSTYSVNIGDPLLQNRFSLARIGWLSSTAIGGTDPNGANPDTGTGPSLSHATAIQACFGLTWGTVGNANGGNKCWSYVGSPAGPGGTLAPFNGKIETLDQVALENREPNFFELLKAAILNGSLGLSPGMAGFGNFSAGSSSYHDGPYTIGVDGLYAYSFDRPGSIPAPSQISDVQIVKIGADIIDEYDADSYPTAIYFKYLGIDNTHDAALAAMPDSYGTSDMVYGEENLPDVQGVEAISATPTATSTNTMEGWWQPQIWNPHQMPNPANTAAAICPQPQTYTIKMYGAPSLDWTLIPADGTSTINGSTFGAPNPQSISFTDSTPATSSFYATPLALTKNGTISNVSITTESDAADMVPSPNVAEYSLNPFVGFWMGSDPAYPVPQDPISDVKTFAVSSQGLSFCLGWNDSGGGFHPYSYMTGIYGYSYSVLAHGMEKGSDGHGSAYPFHTGAEWHMTLDGRTTRFSNLVGWQGPWNYLLNTDFFPNNGQPWWDNGGMTPDQSGWGRPSSANFIWYPVSGDYYEVNWLENNPNPGAVSTNQGLATSVTPTYYEDMDGIARPADGFYGNLTTGDGMSLYTTIYNKPTYTPIAGYGQPTGSPIASGDAGTTDFTGNASHGRRPVILNRPFRSVGELSYAYRDLPFKTLDFFSQYSADAALLDMFSLTDESKVSNNQLASVVAGQFNPSNAPLPVVQAVLAGGSKKDLDPTYNLGTESGTVFKTLAQNIASQLNPATGPNPLMSRADLVTKLNSPSATFPDGAIRDSFSSSADKGNKAYFEAPIRALADVTNTRTWNLLIDVIAQSGHMSPAAATLNDFIVEGEKRYWLHIAIDRYTGKIMAQQLEPVYE